MNEEKPVYVTRPRHQQLLVWQKAMDHTRLAYRLVKQFPPEEKFGLTSQVLRSAVSIAANIAEGSARATPGEFLQALSVAAGENAECQTLWEIAATTGQMDTEDAKAAMQLLGEIGAMLAGLRRRVKNTAGNSPG